MRFKRWVCSNTRGESAGLSSAYSCNARLASFWYWMNNLYVPAVVVPCLILAANWSSSLMRTNTSSNLPLSIDFTFFLGINLEYHGLAASDITGPLYRPSGTYENFTSLAVISIAASDLESCSYSRLSITDRWFFSNITP